MMAESGFPQNRVIQEDRVQFLKMSAIIISKANIPVLETLYLVMLHPEMQKNSVMKEKVWAQPILLSILILQRQSAGMAKLQSSGNMEIFFRCMKR